MRIPSTLLDVQSAYSLLWGTVRPMDLLRRASELGYERVAITDHANLYALPLLVRKGDELPCRPIFGASFPTGAAKTAVLIETQTGYANLCRILTRWHIHSTDASARGLTACIGEEVEGLVFLSDDEAVCRHLHPRPAALHYRVGRTLRQPPAWVDALDLPCAFAPEVALLEEDDYQTHRLLRAIATGATLGEITEAETVSPDAVLAAPEEYADRFAVFEEAIRNSEAIAECIAFRPADAPVFPPSPHRDRPAIRELRERAYGGAEARYGELSESVISRLEYELGLIESKGFAEYFLVVEDIVRHSPRTCGRGSGAASLVNFCLGVTNVDPIKYDLMFERFLNPGRTDPPDIDVDFAWDERDEVLDATFARYGRTQVGMVCNHLTFKSRMAIRETARAFGLADEEITRTLKARLPEFREEIGPVAVCDRHRPVPVKAHRMALSEPWPAILAHAKRILGLPRMLSLHCGGMVIVPGEIAAHVPVEPSAKGYPMIQWEKDGTEEMGLVKIDLLGNRSLAVIRDAVAGVARRTGRPESELLPPYPADDPATQALVRDGGTMGCFYIESPAMRLLQKKARRGDFEHMVIHSSIIRPAANHYINEYLARLRGKPWEPLHPRLKGVFDESYGVPVYQEDVCKLPMALAGFDATRADRLRKCLGKRDAAERLAGYKGSFFQGGRDRGVPSRVLDAAWDAIHSMTGYSFCKPHSASYAQVSFEAAYLKAHYPADFLAAVISNGGGYYSAQAYVSEAMRWGLRIHLPCVNRSQEAFVEENGGIRVGLLAIKGLRQESIERIRAVRAAHGPFRTLPDLRRRTRLSAEDLHRLAIVGALDTVAPTLNRPQILWMLRQMLPSGTERGAAKQAVLFERTDSPSTRSQAAMPPVPPRLPPFSKRQRMEIEYAYLGFLIGAHPLALYEESLREVTRNVIPSTHLAAWAGREVTLLGWPVTGKVVSTKHKEAMEFFSFEDAHGIYETVLFPRAYARYARMLQTAQPFLVSGRVEEEFGACSVHLQHLQTLPTRPVPNRGYTGLSTTSQPR